MSEKTTWDVLAEINCDEHTELKKKLKYLSWSWAWGITKRNFPDANYEVVNYEGKPYLYDENLGYLATTKVTIAGETIPMSLPVLDGANKAQKSTPYTYQVAEWVGGRKTGKFIDKSVEAATMFDINTAIMRCLTKNLAMFGLGHYIYAGEDLPQVNEEEVKAAAEKLLSDGLTDISESKNRDELTVVWDKYPSLQKVGEFTAAAKLRGADLNKDTDENK